jgi:hypothetical protein
LNRSFILTAPVFPVHDEANLMKRQAMLRPLLEQGGGPGAARLSSLGMYHPYLWQFFLGERSEEVINSSHLWQYS